MVVGRSLRSGLLAAAAVLAMGAGEASGPSSATVEARQSGAFASYLVARFAVQSQDLTLATGEFERALQVDPGLPDLTNQAFLAAMLSGQPQAPRLAMALPNSPLAQLVIADGEARAGNWSEAEARYAGLGQDQPLMQILRPLLVAWAEEGAGHTDAALATLAPFVEGPRFRGVYALHAALIADQAGRADEAARLYNIAAADYGPVNLRVGVILASWQARHGMVDEAQRTIGGMTGAESDLAMAREGLASDVSTPAVATAADGIAEAYLALAATLRQQGNETAEVMARLALDMRPAFTAGRILLSDIEVSGKRADAAMATLAQVPASDPLAALVQLRRAGMLADAGKMEAATSLLTQLAQEHPGRPEPYAQLGDIERKQSRYAEAAKTYSEAIARVGTPSRSNWPLFYARGIALERAGDWTRAEPDFKFALELAPDQPSILNYLAYSWAERGEHLDEAREMLQRALSRQPNEGAFIDSLGWVLLRQGDTAGAISQLERAVELEPEDPTINAHFGDALAAAGRMREAEFQWRRALNFKPDEADAKKLTDKLAALPAAGTPH